MKSSFFSRLKCARKQRAERSRRSWMRRGVGFERLEDRQLLASTPISSLNPTSYEPNRLVVGFASSTTPADRALLLSQAGLRVVTDWDNIDATLADTSAFSGGLAAAQQQVLRLGGAKVRYAEADYYLEKRAFTGVIPDDPLWPQQWPHNNGGQLPTVPVGQVPATVVTGTGTPDADIDAPEAWTITTGSSDVIVAIVDSGVWYDHPDLNANMWVNPGEIPGDMIDNDANGVIDDVYGADFGNVDGDPMDDDGHGTHVAGIVAAVGDNALGVAGVSWNAQIMAVKLFGATGGTVAQTTADAISAVDYVTMMKNRGFNIVASNHSWGLPLGTPQPQALIDAFAAHIDAGIVAVCAAGNTTTNNDLIPDTPSGFPLDGIIAVASTDQNDLMSTFSCYGAQSVDIGAPGQNILSTMMTAYTTTPAPAESSPTGYGVLSGTSMASPLVAGAVAVIRGLDPTLSVQETINLIQSGVDPLPSLAGRTKWQGRLNLYNSLSLMDHGEIRGTVWTDSNKDGRRDDYESGLADWTVYVDLDEDGLPDKGEPSTITDADGAYVLFNYREAGDYTIRVLNKPGFTQTRPAAGAGQTVTLDTRNGIVTDIDFAFVSQSGKISGYKWNDANGNARKDSTEKGLAGWTIYADLDRDGLLDLGEPQMPTNAVGYYELSVPSGTVWMREVQKVGYRQTYPVNPNYHVVTVAPAGSVKNINFGNEVFSEMDFGDAPAPYPTLLEDNGARAGLLADVHLGPSVDDGGVGIDGEADGFQDADNPDVSDETTDVADEDGIVFTSDLSPGATATVEVTVSLGNNPAGLLQAWIDFNGNGSWADAGEQIFTNKTLGAGVNSLSFPVPATAKPGSTWARFRYGYEKNISFTGAAYVGEVEDYRVDILSTKPIAVNDTYNVMQDSQDNVLDVLANDIPSIYGGLRLTDQLGLSGTAGTVVIDRRGTPRDYTDDVILYTPASNVFAPDAFSYTIADARGQTATTTVLITITESEGTVPLAVDDSFTQDDYQYWPYLDVLANDRRGPTGSISIPANGLDTSGLQGEAQLDEYDFDGDGEEEQCVRYDPTGAVGATQFRYTIVDAAGVPSEATVTVHMPSFSSNDDLVRFYVEITDLDYKALKDENNNGVPDIGQGQQFRVNIYAEDLRDDGFHPDLPAGLTEDDQGVFSAYMDLLYDSGLVWFSDVDWSRLNPSDPTDHWDDYDSAGAFYNSSVPGILNEIGSFSFQGGFAPLGINPYFNAPKHFLTSAVFTAAQEGLATFTTDPADNLSLHETALYEPPEPAIEYQYIEFDAASVEVVLSPTEVEIELKVTDLQGKDLPNNQVAPGQEFLVWAVVDDVRPTTVIPKASQGVYSAYLDLLFPNQLVTPVADAGNPLGFDIEFVDGPFGDCPFGDGQTGTLTTVPSPRINDVGAYQGFNRVLEDDGQGKTLFQVRFRALTPPAGASNTVVFDAEPVSYTDAEIQELYQVTVINPYPGQDVPIYQVSYIDAPTIVIRAFNTLVGGEGEYTNPNNPLDVNDDGFVSPIDVLAVVNYLNAFGATRLITGAAGEGEAASHLYFDVNGDGYISPMDALGVVNHLNVAAITRAASGEGEALTGNLPASPAAAAAADTVPAASAASVPVSSAATPRAQAEEPVVAVAEELDRDSGTRAGTALESVLSDDLLEDILGGWEDASLAAV